MDAYQAIEQGSQELLVDTAISHLEKLRRVLMLESWIRDAAQDPLLEARCRGWHAERAKLLEQLHLEEVAEPGGIRRAPGSAAFPPGAKRAPQSSGSRTAR